MPDGRPLAPKTSPVDTVIFDFDGVLVESVNVKTEAFARVFEPYGAEAVKTMVDYHLDNGGVSRFDKFRYFYRHVLDKPMTDTDMQQLCDNFSALVVSRVVEAPWVAGAEAFLDRHHRALELFVVSATPEKELKAIISRRGMDKYFKTVFGAPKDKAVAVAEICAAGGETAGTVFVGDALADFEAAKSASLKFIGRVPRSADRNIFAPFQVPIIADLNGLAGAVGLEN